MVSSGSAVRCLICPCSPATHAAMGPACMYATNASRALYLAIGIARHSDRSSQTLVAAPSAGRRAQAGRIPCHRSIKCQPPWGPAGTAALVPVKLLPHSCSLHEPASRLSGIELAPKSVTASINSPVSTGGHCARIVGTRLLASTYHASSRSLRSLTETDSVANAS